MTEFVRDPLNGTPGDDLSAANPNWVRQPGISGAFIIAPDGESVATTASTSTAAYYRSDAIPPSADYSVSADITLVDFFINASAAGVIGRASNSAITHYQARFLASSNAPNGTWQLRRVVNNSATTLASIAGTLTPGQKVNVKLSMVGNLVSMYLDNSPEPLLGPSAGSTITAAGFPGLLGANIPGNRVRMDNFAADDGQAAGQNGTATVVGVASGPATGFVGASGDGAASMSGVTGNPAVGSIQASAAGSADAAIVGVAARPASGTIAATGSAAVQVVGVAATPAIGSIAASATVGGAANAIILGIAATPRVGGIAARGGALAVVGGVSEEAPPIGAPLGGVAANPAVGQIVARSNTAPLQALLRRIPLARDFRTKTIHFSN